MASWSPREAAEYRAAMNAQMLRDLAIDKVARRGLRRLVGRHRSRVWLRVAAGHDDGQVLLKVRHFWQLADAKPCPAGVAPLLLPDPNSFRVCTLI
jgi:hypothetical protein